uniref:conserved chloroplast protein Ycf1/TIC214 n=1 Tax=Prototheca lentecrescens TaxID=2836214 RepID=UPI003002E3E9
MSTTLSLSTIIRDYTEVISGISRMLGDTLKTESLFKESILFCGSVLEQIINYIAKSVFALRDFSLFYIDSDTATDDEDLLHKEDLTIDISEIDNIRENPLITGFLNSLFLVFPVSVIHIVTIRRLIIQGIPAAVYTLGGYLFGQLIFIFCVIFGIRSIIIPWLTLEPLTYFLGLIILGRIIFSIRFESFLPLDTWDHPIYKKYFIYSFLVALAEQGTIFPYLANMTFSVNSSILQGYHSRNFFIFFIKNFSYILGLFCGCLVFSGLWFFFFLKIKSLIFNRILFFRDVFISRFNKFCHIVTIAIVVATLPYYSIHYLFLGALGFMPEDRVLQNTIFSDSFIKDIAGEISSMTFPISQTMELKLIPFNKGDYLIFPEEPQTFSMEDLIYRSDYAWIRRMEKLSTDVLTTHVRGKQLSRNLGFRAGEKSVAARVLPKQTPLMTYRLDLNNRFEEDKINILKENLDFEYNKKKDTQKEIKEENVDISRLTKKELSQLPHDPILDRYFQWYDFENLDINTIIEEGADEFETSTDAIDNIIYYFVRNLVQSPFLFSSAFLQNQRDIGFGPFEIGLRTKQQYHQSFIFKSLIKAEMSFFLNREPKKWRLNGEYEYDLQAKRNILVRHFDFLRSYRRLPNGLYQIFSDFFGGSINISSQIYNQQFTGTLRNLTRFFNLTFDDEQSFKENQILNYLEESNSNKFQKDSNENKEEQEEKNANDFSSQELKNLIFKNPTEFIKKIDLNEEDELEDNDLTNIKVQEEKYTKLDKNKENPADLSLELIHKPISDEELSKLKRKNVVLNFDQSLYKHKASNFDIGPEPHEELKRKVKRPRRFKKNRVIFENLLCTPFHYTINHKLCNHLGYKLLTGLLIEPDTFRNQGIRDFGFNYLKRRLKSIGLYYKIQKDALMKDRLDAFDKINRSPDSLFLFSRDLFGELTAFTCWPLPDEILHHLKPPYKENLQFNLLTETKEQIESVEEDELTFDLFDLVEDEEPLSFTRFWILEYMYEDGLRDSQTLLTLFVPQKGGFVWPGIDDIYIPGLKRRKKRYTLDKMIKDEEEYEDEENEEEYEDEENEEEYEDEDEN